MNINDLKPGSYKVIQEAPVKTAAPLNIKDLPTGSYKELPTTPTYTSPAKPEVKPLFVKPDQPTPGGTFVKGVAKKMFGTYKDTIQKIPEDIKAGAADIEKGGVKNVVKGLFKGGVRTAADAAGAIFAPVTAAVSQAMEQTGAQKGIDKAAEFIVDKTKIAENPAFQEFAMKHPNAEDDFTRALTLIMSGGKNEINPKRMVEEVKNPKPFLAKAKQAMVDTNAKVKNAYETRTIEQAKQDTAKNMPKLVDKAKATTSKVLQTEPKEIPSAQKALKVTDTKGVKTYKDLSERFEKKIDENKSMVDERLDKDQTAHKSETLVEKNPTKTDYTQKAINQLKEFYDKTENAKELQTIQQLETKYREQGLTAKEINELARQHGRDLNAFNQNGQLASGLSRQAAENVRTGVKETARELMPEENTRAIDRETTDLIRAKELADEMETKVQKLQNTVEKAGKLKKFGSFLGKAVNIATGRLGEGFIRSFFPDFGHLKGDIRLNPLDLEQRLQKNLKVLDNLNSMSPEEAIANLEKMFKNN